MSIKGLDTVEAVLLLIKNPESYDAKLQEIREATAKYQEVVEAVVELSKVNDYTTSIKQREVESKALLEKAKEEASSIKEAAKTAAVKVKVDLQNREERVATREKDCAQTEVVLSEKYTALQILEQKLKDVERALQIKETQVTTSLLEIEERKAKLKAALSA